MLTEAKLREIIQSIILEKVGFRINPFSSLLSGDKSNEETAVDPFNIDASKLDSGVDIERIKYLARETGLPPDFIYGIESKESNHKPGVMAWNTHHYRRHSGDSSFYPNKKSVYGSEARRMFKEAAAKNLSAAIKAGAWGLYQVLGSWSLPRYGNDTNKWLQKWQSDPAQHSADAFIDWVAKYQKSVGFVDMVNRGDYAKATRYYYGALKSSYYNYVIKKAKEWNNSIIKPAVVTNNQTGGTGSAQGKAWKLGGRIGGGDNFDRMQCGPNNYRSAIPPRNAQFFKDMNASYGIDTVITLNADSGGSKVPAKVKQAGLRSIYIPLGSTGPSSSDWSTIKQAFDRGNVLIHCTHGADRTGAVVARYEAEKCNKNKNQAYKDSLKYGFKKPSFAYKGGKPDPNKQLRQWILAENNYVRLDKKQLRSIINEVLQEKSAFNINVGGVNSTSTSSSASASPIGLGNVNKSSGNIVIAGDSQMGKNNGFGSVLRNIFPNAKATVNSSGHAGTLINISNFERSLKDAELVVLTLGGHPSNKSSNIKALIKKIRKIAPDSQIIWIGAPPAFPPSSNNSMVSNNESSAKWWKKKRKSRGKRNTMIKGVIDAIENAKFINPYDYLSIDKYKPKGDGIHVPKGSGGFLKKLLS